MSTQGFWVVLFTVSMFGMFYPVVIYPLILWLLTNRRNVAAINVTTAPCLPFSIIIPAHNEEKVIGAKLRNMLEGTADLPGQVIVSADGCNDETCNIVASFGSAVELVVVKERCGILGAFQAGLAQARHDIIFFSDADILINKETIPIMMRHFSDPMVGGVCSSTNLTVREGSGLKAEKLNAFLRRWILMRQSKHYSAIGADGSNWAVRRDLIKWPTTLQLAEDLVIPLEVIRQGYKFLYEPAANALEISSASIMDEFHRKVRTIAGGIQAGRYCSWIFHYPHWNAGFHYLSWKIGKYLIPIWVTLALISASVLSQSFLFFRIFIASTVLAVGFALGGGIARWWGLKHTPKIIGTAWYGLVSLIMPIAAIGYLINHRATVLWRISPR